MNNDKSTICTLDFTMLAAQVKAAREAFKEYIAEMDDAYVQRVKNRPQNQPVPAWLGHGRAGKDEAGKWLAKHSDLKYNGSTSTIVLPLVAHALQKPEDQAFVERHQNREYWFHFCNILRADDPTCLARWNLAQADQVVGIRSLHELQACIKDKVVSDTIWINNPRVPVDPTVEFSVTDCKHVLSNAGTLQDYYDVLGPFCRSIGIAVKETGNG